MLLYASCQIVRLLDEINLSGPCVMHPNVLIAIPQNPINSPVGIELKTHMYSNRPTYNPETGKQVSVISRITSFEISVADLII